MTASTGNGRLEPSPGRDYCSQAGAAALAADIRRFWAGLGHEVPGVDRTRSRRQEPVWIVKSTLRGGLPPPDSITPPDSIRSGAAP